MKKKLQKIFNKTKTLLIIVLGSIVCYYGFHFYFTIDMVKVAKIDNITLYTDTKDSIYKNDIMLVLDSCLRVLEQNNIQSKTNERIILCTDINKYSWKTFFLHKNTLGVNYYFFNAIIMAPADYKNNKQNKYDERLINRRLSDAIVHEIIHLYLREKIGYFTNMKMAFFQKWKIEGFCEYIANSSSFNIEEGKRIFLNTADSKDELLNSQLMKTCYFYFKSRLKVDYLLSYKKLTFNEFITTNFNEKNLENEIRHKLLSSEYVFNKQ